MVCVLFDGKMTPKNCHLTISQTSDDARSLWNISPWKARIISCFITRNIDLIKTAYFIFAQVFNISVSLMDKYYYAIQGMLVISRYIALDIWSICRSYVNWCCMNVVYLSHKHHLWCANQCSKYRKKSVHYDTPCSLLTICVYVCLEHLWPTKPQ